MPGDSQVQVIAPTPITEIEPARVWTEEEKVEYLIDRQWSITRIARKTGLTRERVARVVEAIDDRRLAEICSSEARKARYVAHNQAVAEQVWQEVERGGNVRLLKIALEAQQQTIKVRGDFAPTKTVNFEWKAHALVNPEVQARVMADPRAREALLILEEFAASPPPALPDGGGE